MYDEWHYWKLYVFKYLRVNKMVELIYKFRPMRIIRWIDKGKICQICKRKQKRGIIYNSFLISCFTRYN